ncbi:F-box protein At3g07870-like [Coffea eugenioides]|uniref:F-box protein At3g07870-like n=2 Tax=Coffea eugenioides TaxID=49369 RepID=UPI000F60A054|nr:F-box protein At3g07870-like [Coffea eugenioides]
MMKRKRNSKAVGSQHVERDADEETETKSTSILDLPDFIFKDVVLRLPLKAIIMCKCVCKPWRRIISDPQFAKMHFASAQPCPLVRTLGNSRVSRMLYLIEPSEINVSYNSDNYSPDGVNLKLETKLKIPLRNAEMVPQNPSGAKLSLCSKGGSKKRCMNVRTIKVRTKEQKFQIVNSCNGILCLSDPSYNNPLAICNPVTGEYLNLPAIDEVDNSLNDIVSCGFGFSEKTNEYKVIRLFDQGRLELISCPITGKEVFGKRVAEVHTVGSGSWRRIGHAPSYGCELRFTTCLKGSLHWIRKDDRKLDFIYSFDLSQEQFKAIQPPPLEHRMKDWDNLRNLSLGVLNNSLCLCVGPVFDDIDIWVMQKHGEPKSWTKFISINLSVYDRWPVGVYHPINFLESKGLLMFQCPKSAFMYYEPQFDQWKYFRIQDIKMKFEAVAHTPSLILLKDVVTGDNAEILNVNSRCNEFKLLGETKDLFLVEEIRDLEIDTDASSYSYSDEE